ncbi:MAG: Phosphoesterase PA-phosphatase related protein [Candidatus Gottesmanbacteria bacterium GW2011_GWC2_39_8]|uniref:Phosphoesterase PA-phosphatase related protein n=1 Tax=Candidatus Gottesmanbacteria bacterium GW2011_GWC2_39_8 TaxID=1618450 RepID=A0A0G0PXT1_9BACT|nr:MAG: Phosphoesterase PA-phosphatase related protein [Candidatus Gottesmanbacteria bacterium GW2011_GWC2_39_8]
MRRHTKRLIEKWKLMGLYERFLLGGAVLYMVGVSVYMLWHRAWFSPDQFFFFAFFGVLLLGKTRQFLFDWIPIMLLLFGYEYLRGLGPVLTKNVNIFPMIKADKFMFGEIPSIRLQNALFVDNVTHWYDYLAVILYISHFVIPMMIAFLFWLDDRKHFKEYMAGLLILSYTAFITYMLYPAMPPWMASNLGYIPPLKKVMDQVLANFATPIDVPSVYRFFGANLVAAVPSLHAAYPWLIFLFVFKRLKKIALLLLPYVFGVWFSIIYLGEHYVIDGIIGVIYATIAFIIIVRFRTIIRVTKSFKSGLSYRLRV